MNPNVAAKTASIRPIRAVTDFELVIGAPGATARFALSAANAAEIEFGFLVSRSSERRSEIIVSANSANTHVASIVDSANDVDWAGSFVGISSKRAFFFGSPSSERNSAPSLIAEDGMIFSEASLGDSLCIGAFSASAFQVTKRRR